MKRLITVLAGCWIIMAGSLSAGEPLLLHAGYVEGAGGAFEDEQGQHWNRIGTWGKVTKSQLVMADGSACEVVWETLERFSFFFPHGPEMSDLGYPDAVARAGVYLAPKEKIGAEGPFEVSRFLVSGLEPLASYTVTFYGSRMAGFSGDLALVLRAQGAATASTTLFISAKDAPEAEATLTLPASDSGQITIHCNVPEGYRRGSLNAVKVTPTLHP